MGRSGLDKASWVCRQTTKICCVFFQTELVHPDRQRSYESVLWDFRINSLIITWIPNYRTAEIPDYRVAERRANDSLSTQLVGWQINCEEWRRNWSWLITGFKLEFSHKYGGNIEKPLSGLQDTWPRFEPKNLWIRSSIANQWAVNFL
jgi:hypothetical protein